MRWIALALLVSCTGSVVPKGPGVHIYKDTFRTKYVKNGKVSDNRLSEVIAENFQAKKLAERSERLTMLTWIPAVAFGGCLAWQFLEWDKDARPVGRDYAALGCTIAALYTTLILEHGAKAAKLDAINQYNNDLLVK